MREKPVSHKTVERYIDFLNGVRDNSLPYECQVTITAIAMSDGVSKSAPAELVKMGVIEKESPKRWKWVNKGEPSKELALKLLDNLLHANKKTIHVPIDGLGDIAAVLKTISERLAHITTQHERGLKTSKIVSNGDADLFKISDERLYIAGQIAPGIYNAVFKYITNPGDTASIESTNEMIVLATDDLLLQLRGNKQ